MLRKLKNCGHFLNALLAVLFYRYPARRLTVIGVTGTDGKTTTSTLIYHILQTAGLPTALITTVGGRMGERHIDTGFHTTTPSPWALQKLIRTIADEGFRYLVLECTSHGLDQHRLLATNPYIAVMTNLSREHLDYHGTMQRYLAAKAKLFHSAKYSILNGDDPSFEPLKRAIGQLVITYSKKSTPKYVKARFSQAFNQSNAQAAISCARLLKIDESIISQAIATFASVPGRQEEVFSKGKPRVVVDFAHTPNALENVLSSLRQSTKGKLITVFGATGRRDTGKRPLMGEIVAKLSDFFIITSDDSYDENANVIINQIKSGITTNHGNFLSLVDRKSAIATAIARAGANDTIALLGKGHEQAINLDGKTETPWSDKQIALKLLTKRKAA